jgi:ABC-type antimicrobial peptide transport system permease subunit
MYASAFSIPPQYPLSMSQDSILFPALIKEWTLLERTLNQTASKKKYRTLGATNWRGAILDIKTIHEFAGDVLDFEKTIGLVTIVGVLILFLIIQIGVVNTLRMTIRERTREIGTIRAIGMQRSAVRWSFIIEVVLLTFFACLTGIVLAVLLMEGLSVIAFDTGDSEMGFFFVNNHLHFVLQPGGIVKNLVIILGIALLTAFLPSGKAAKLSVVKALGHYE